MYQSQNSWSGGFQALVTVTAGNTPINGWTVRWTLASGQSITQLWNGTLSTSGSSVTVTNASYNGALAAGASTTFGFTAAGSPSNPRLTCTSP
ncbi:cellulose binding domain-containing protein [Actinocrinis sp.]|uniref:cellulose binding domain-containing protein n=1 Tax=Actinocrinis sp. TaxID=1920516 RepID=UPI0032C225A9